MKVIFITIEIIKTLYPSILVYNKINDLSMDFFIKSNDLMAADLVHINKK